MSNPYGAPLAGSSMPLVLEPSWVGRRVSVRRVVDRTPAGQLVFGDVVGELVFLDQDTAVLEARAGRIEVPVGLVAVAKLVHPSTADELAVEAVAARGWRAEHTAELGGWLLRAASGFTGRANSVLPLRQLGMPLEDALAAARAWYDARGLPLVVQVPVEARRLLDAELGERGWPADPLVHVLTARLDMLLSDAVAPAEVHIADSPDEGWLARFRDGAGLSAAARALLVRHDHAGFASIAVEGQVVAIGRGALDDGWLGVTAVEVDPALRREGLATAIMRALWRWGAANGAVRSYLQVSSDNPAALALYRGLGYWQHHDYHYRRDPIAQLSAG
jgi:ribosomal protein S18 acetylase RimI-like enzyme